MMVEKKVDRRAAYSVGKKDTMMVVRKADVRVVPSAARAAERWAASMVAYLAGN